MVALRFDSMGSFALRWPSSYRAVVALGEAYVAYEGSLPPEAQLQDISLTMIEAALAEAKAAVVAAQKGERARASAGEVVQQTHQAIKPLLDRGVGVDDGHSQFGQEFADRGFARSDGAGDTQTNHSRVRVLLAWLL